MSTSLNLHAARMAFKREYLFAYRCTGMNLTKNRWSRRPPASLILIMACHSSHLTGVTVGRAPAYAKRGGGAPHLDLEEVAVVSPDRGTDIVALDEALTSLAALSPRQSQVVELRFFGGLSLEETAEVLKVSIGTVRRDWSLARAWLHRAVTSN